MKNKMKNIKRALKAQIYNPELLLNSMMVTFIVNNECLKPQSYLYKASISKLKAFEISKKLRILDIITIKSNFF